MCLLFVYTGPKSSIHSFSFLDKTAEDIDQQFLPRNQSFAKYCGCLYKKEPASEIC